MINIESTHIDPVAGQLEVKLVGLKEPVKFLVGVWQPDLMGQVDEFILSHPDVAGGEAAPTSYHLWNPVAGAWALPPGALAKAKADQWARIKKARTQAEWAGFLWDGSLFDSDPVSQQRLTSAVVLAQVAVEGFELDWTLKDNSVRTLSAADMVGAGAALGAHVAGTFARSQVLRTSLNAAETVESALSVKW